VSNHVRGSACPDGQRAAWRPGGHQHPAGQQTTRTDPRGQVTTYAWDDDGRQTGVEYQDGTRVTYVFDDAGRRTSMADLTGTTTYTLNAGGHLTAVAQPGGKTVTYTLEAAGRRQAMIDPDSGRTTYSYDGANRVTSLLNPFAERTTYGYDALGRATTITLANGAVTTATFDAAGRQTGMRHSKDGTQLQSFAYSYDNSGRRTGVVEGGGDRVTWTYDLAGKLTREQRSGDSAYDITYAYDPVGNRLTMLTGGVTTTYSYNAGDELTVANEGGTLTTYSYDANGNTTVENAAGSLTTYAWDDENRLKVLTPSSGDPATMTYDATGLRRTRAVGAVTVRFVWDGQKVILETDGGGTTQAQFTLNLGLYGDLISQRRSSTSRWYHFDALGSTDRLTGADGSATDTYIYKAFGPLAASTGSTTNPFRYVGKLGYYDQGTGPLYVRARWLRPTTGSWLSVDPVEGQPRHVYVQANPVMEVDAAGLATIGETCKDGHFGDKLQKIKDAVDYMDKNVDWSCVGSDLRECAVNTWSTLNIECGYGGNRYKQYCNKDDEPYFCGCTVPGETGTIVICPDTPGCQTEWPCWIFHELTHRALFDCLPGWGDREEHERQAWQCTLNCARVPVPPGEQPLVGPPEPPRRCHPGFGPGNEGDAPCNICPECCGWLPDYYPPGPYEKCSINSQVCFWPGVLIHLCVPALTSPGNRCKRECPNRETNRYPCLPGAGTVGGSGLSSCGPA